MGLFNNETERKAGLDPSVVMPQSLPAQAVSVPPPADSILLGQACRTKAPTLRLPAPVPIWTKARR
jgi:hypothetical protein